MSPYAVSTMKHNFIRFTRAEADPTDSTSEVTIDVYRIESFEQVNVGTRVVMRSGAHHHLHTPYQKFLEMFEKDFEE